MCGITEWLNKKISLELALKDADDELQLLPTGREIIREENQCKVNRRRSDKHIKLIEDYYIARQNFIEQITLGLLCL